MVLIVLFFLSSIFVLINIEPLTVTGVLLSICYLPGLCILSLGKREKLSFADLILAFPCSVGFSSILTLGLLASGMEVETVYSVIQIIVGVAVIIFLIFRKIIHVEGIEKEDVIFCVVAFFFVLLLSIPFFLGPNRATFAAHSFHHSSFVTQVLNGIFPPENPGLGGTDIGYYWAYHSFIAAITSKTAYHQIQIFFILNALSLFMIFCISYVFAKALGLPEKYRYITPLAVIGLMRFDVLIFFVLQLISGNVMPSENLLSQEFLFPMDVFNIWMEGIPWYDTRLFYLNKIYNISAMPVAIVMCLAYFLILFNFLKDNGRSRKTDMTCLSFVIIGCVLNYPPLAIFILLHLPVWANVVLLSYRGNIKEKIKESLKIAIPYAAGMLTVLPYLLFIMMNRKISSAAQGGVFELDFYAQSFKNLVVFAISCPVIIYGIFIAYKRLSFSREFFFLLTGAALGLILTVFTRWPFNNSYKFNYILTFFFALFFMFGLSGWLETAGRLFRRITCVAVILILLSSPLLVEASYIIACLSKERNFKISNGHIYYALDIQKNEAYAWIRENTPRTALIMLGYIETTYPCCGNNRNYEVAAIAERNLYVIKDEDYTISNPVYAERVRFRRKLFENPDDPRVIHFYNALNQPVYLLVEEILPEVFVVEDRFGKFPDNPGKHFKLVFRNDKQRIYRLVF